MTTLITKLINLYNINLVNRNYNTSDKLTIVNYSINNWKNQDWFNKTFNKLPKEFVERFVGFTATGSFSNASSNFSNTNFTSWGLVSAATGISETFATVAATIAKSNLKAAMVTASIGATAGIIIFIKGEMTQAIKEERKEENRYIREMNERSSSPPPDGNFKVNSPNEDGNNLVEFFSKFIENPQDVFNLLNEYFRGSDGNPIPIFIFLICTFAFWGIVCCFFLIMSMLSKLIKIEEREFIKNRPLLHKLVCLSISLRDWNNFVFLILTLFCFIGILGNCYVLNELFWFTDSHK